MITENTKAIFIETPTNPLMLEINIEQYVELAKKHDLLVIVDNTFLTPYFQRPIELGADIVIHSATKYIGGHNDVLAGLVVAKGEKLCDQLGENHNAIGATLSPFDSWLVIRGLKTLHVRMKQHDANAKEIVSYLENEPLVEDVLYAGKAAWFRSGCGIANGSIRFYKIYALITFAESLGGGESLITYPTTQTHADIPEEEREKRGVDKRLLRFSVGLEEAGDIIADFKQALAIAAETTAVSQQ